MALQTADALNAQIDAQSPATKRGQATVTFGPYPLPGNICEGYVFGGPGGGCGSPSGRWLQWDSSQTLATQATAVINGMKPTG